MQVDRIDPAFGHWFAGFADGEGSFGITRVGRPPHSYICTFVIGLRVDDRAILDEIVTRTNLGRVFLKNTSGMQTPQAWWQVCRKLDCAELVAVFDHFPLRAKKARDFVIWRDAVAEWHKHTNRGPLKGRAGRDWSPMARLAQELKDVRKYIPEQEVAHG